MRKSVCIVSALLALAGLFATPASAERRLALVIGNDRYEKLPSLQKAVNDAGAMEAALSGLGFMVTRVTNASRRTMNERIESFAGQVNRGDTALFFFAGHGVEIKGVNYLLPTDTPEARDGQEGLISREAVPADSIIERLQERGARVTMLVLDACRDNPFKKSGTRGVGGTRGLAQMTPAEGVFVLFSAGLGQTALDRLSDSDANPNSVFTRTFIAQLAKPGLSVLDIAKATQTEVRKLALTVDHRQQPAFYDQIDGVYVLKASAGGGPVPAPAPPALARPAPPPVAALPPASTPAPSAPSGAVSAVFTSRSAGIGSGPPNVQAANFPAQQITLIVPFAAGGPIDYVARTLAPPMSAALGRPVVVENMTGGNGAVGMMKARGAAPDGHTLVMSGSLSLVSNLAQQGKYYDPVADFSGIGLIGANPVVIAAKKDLAVNDLAGLIAYVKGRNGAASYGSSGAGSPSHLACHQFNTLAGTRSVNVTHKGTSEAVAELVKGNVDYLCMERTAITAPLREKQIKPLGVSSSERLGSLPGVQTTAEAGLPGFATSSWYGLFAPNGTGKGVIDKLAWALGRALDDAATRKKLEKAIAEFPAAAYRTPQALDAFLRAEAAKWAPIASAARAN